MKKKEGGGGGRKKKKKSTSLEKVSKKTNLIQASVLQIPNLVSNNAGSEEHANLIFFEISFSNNLSGIVLSESCVHRISPRNFHW